MGLVAAEVDLSGRHLEQLPTALFSSLHLTSINLSHNLLAPTTSAAVSARRRHRGHNRKRRDRRRRLVPPERQETLGARARSRPTASDHDCHNPTGSTYGRASEEDGLSGDSGVPSDPVEEDSQRRDPEGTARKTRPERWSFADELQEKLRLRRAASEGCYAAKINTEGISVKQAQLRPAYIQLLDSSHLPKDTSTSTNESATLPTPPLTPPLSSPQLSAPNRPFLTDAPSSSRSTSSIRSRSEGLGCNEVKGDRGSYEDSSSSGVDESDNASEEGEETTVGGEVLTSSVRSLGALHQLRHFQQLQVCTFTIPSSRDENFRFLA